MKTCISLELHTSASMMCCEQVAAACCGIFGFRTSHGVLPMEGVATVAASLETPAWTAASAQTLTAVGTALDLPGADHVETVDMMMPVTCCRSDGHQEAA